MTDPADLPTILVVDDNADTVRFLARLLRSEGYAVVTAESVAAATAAAAARPPALLVSDLGLPDGSGLDLIRSLRATYPDLRGIALTGRTADEDRDATRAAGFCRHLAKPVEFDALTRAVAALLGRPGHAAAPVTSA